MALGPGHDGFDCRLSWCQQRRRHQRLCGRSLGGTPPYLGPRLIDPAGVDDRLPFSHEAADGFPFSVDRPAVDRLEVVDPAQQGGLARAE